MAVQPGDQPGPIGCEIFFFRIELFEVFEITRNFKIIMVEPQGSSSNLTRLPSTNCEVKPVDVVSNLK